MSTDQHEQQTEFTNIDETKLTYPDDTQLANDDSTEIDYTIRLVLANTDDSEKENDRPDIRRFDIARSLEHNTEENTSIAHRGHDNNQGSTDRTHRGRQALPTDISNASSRATSPSHRTSRDDGEIRGCKGNHGPLSEIPITTERDVIEALTTSEQLVKSAKELLSTPAVLALSLQQMTTSDSQPSGSC